MSERQNIVLTQAIPNTAQIRKLKKSLESIGEKWHKPMAAALRRALSKMQSLAVKTTAKALGAKQKDVRQKRIWSRKPSRRHLFVRLTAGKIGLPISRRMKKAALSLQPNQFFASMGQGLEGRAFERVGMSRLPIRKVFSMSPTRIMRRYGRDKDTLDEGGRVLMKRLEHEVDRRLKKNAGA